MLNSILNSYLSSIRFVNRRFTKIYLTPLSFRFSAVNYAAIVLNFVNEVS